MISIWVMLVAFVGGFFSGFLGGGAGYIGCPRWFMLGIRRIWRSGPICSRRDFATDVLARGEGNVDILIALVMHTGAAIGRRSLTAQYSPAKIRLAFVPLPLIGAAIVIYTLLTGHKL
jgi:hypothetical protein